MLDQWTDNYIAVHGGPKKFKISVARNDRDGESPQSTLKKKRTRGITLEDIARSKDVKKSKVPLDFVLHVQGRFIDDKLGGKGKEAIYDLQAVPEMIKELIVFYGGPIGQTWKVNRATGFRPDTSNPW